MEPTIIVPVILCGGSGSRLWPLSRGAYPKQLLKLFAETSLLEATLHRARTVSVHAPILVTNEEHRFLVAEEARRAGIDEATILLEPEGRNTAPALALAAMLQEQRDTLLLVLPSDQMIRDSAGFAAAVACAVPLAEQGLLVTFGVQPTRAETGYGYIQRGVAIERGFRIARFIEKPPLAEAENYATSGEHLWNAGMFLLRADRFLEELTQHRPDIARACTQAMAQATHDLTFCRPDGQAFRACPADSIDYAVMEKTTQAAVVPLDAGWSDVGSFASLWEESAQDANGNVAYGDSQLQDCRNTLVWSESRLVSVIGVQDLVVVETADAVLVVPRERAQDVKKMVDTLKAAQRSEQQHHQKVYRPWGHYECIEDGERYLVKRIAVNPGASLSLQMHYHRAEHWVVVKGTAEVTCEDKTYLVAENESTFIPLGHKHRLKNPGKTVLEMVEVQSGSYLGEDDIVRFDDHYGRT